MAERTSCTLYGLNLCLLVRYVRSASPVVPQQHPTTERYFAFVFLSMLSPLGVNEFATGQVLLLHRACLKINEGDP